jgi:flagellar protein FlaG
MDKLSSVAVADLAPSVAIKPKTNDAGVAQVRPVNTTGSAATPALAPVKPKLVDINLNNDKQINDYKKNKQALETVVQDLRQRLEDGGRGLSFSVDEQLGRFVLLVKKSDTGEVIRQIPSDVVLRVAHNFEQLKGLLFNRTI